MKIYCHTKIFFSIVFLLSTISITVGQDSTLNDIPKKEVQWNKLKREFALDIRNLNFSGNIGDVGTNLIFKKYFGEKKYIAINERKAMRFQISGSAEYPISKSDTIGQYDFGNIGSFTQKNINIGILVGIEWQTQMKRLQLYYGFDSGIAFNKRLDPYYNRIYFTNGSFYGFVSKDELNLSVPIFGFVGLKYSLHPRVSLSIESSIFTGVSWSTIEINEFVIDNMESSLVSKGKSLDLLFGTRYLRLLNCSFHF